ncbi:MAG TPA: RagB/SusD family nutrient uptake outer membrane protein, partial [Paludibacteraceae bacterium]|nr:RagB/SusD family nutrient uptake outer membrane protein [Paludibacteraceae bacterium]
IPAEDYRKKWFNGKDKNPNQAQKGAQEPYANLKFGFDGSWTMDYMYMRSAEMILIEAEALARQSKFTEATTVMHELLDSRFDEWEPGADVTVEDILLQRRIELWGEGFAYFDLKRLHRGIDRTYSGSNHRKPDGTLKVDAGDVRWTYQIPLREIQENTEISEEDNNK